MAFSKFPKKSVHLLLVWSSIESEVCWNTLECNSSWTCFNKPSMVVKRPPKVPGVKSRFNSGMVNPQVSDFRMSLAKSSASSTIKVIFLPLSGMAPPVLTSLDLTSGGEGLHFVVEVLNVRFVRDETSGGWVSLLGGQLFDFLTADLFQLVLCDQPDLDVLFVGSEVFNMRPLVGCFVWNELDPRVTSWIVDFESQRQSTLGTFDGGLDLGDELFDTVMDRLVNFKSFLLAGLQVVDHLSQEALDVGHLASLWWNLDIQLFEVTSGGLLLDDLSVEILLGFDSQSVLGALFLDRTGWLQLGVLEPTVVTLETHDDDLGKVWDGGQKKTSDTSFVTVHT
ncbi:hypothetical protein WICPIJ_003687 [Wickerhamomyces pijperi]|uniref:Uncharacterized protein n=1 Tax=Wickerhamomyces pijperi TaxID=599730 RepID=A0A9P8Q947_WICPI|nr:hypothetical protein WICPIJ_003687 [Wickerhamomyces pijperi]